MPKKLLVRFPVSSNALIQPGTPLNAGHFQPGQFVDVISKTSRKGFHGTLYVRNIFFVKIEFDFS